MSSGNDNPALARKTYLDALRIIGTFLVLFNHTPGYTLYQNTEPGCRLWAYMSITMLTRINWPLFLMISGALMLSRPQGAIRKTRRTKIKRYFVVLVVYQVILLSIANARGKGPATVPGWMLAILSNDYKGAKASTWYLYAYLAFLIMLPYVRSIAGEFKKSDFILLLVAYFAFNTALPMLQGVMKWNNPDGTGIKVNQYFELAIVTSRVFFWPLLGHFVENGIEMNRVKPRHLILLSAGAILGIFVSDLFCYLDGMKNGFSYRYNSISCYVTAIWVFLLVKYLFYVRKKDNSGRAGCAMEFVASLTFGIYLLDPLLKETGCKTLLDNALSTVPALGKSLIWCVLSFVVCGTVAAGMKRIPWLRDYI